MCEIRRDFWINGLTQIFVSRKFADADAAKRYSTVELSSAGAYLLAAPGAVICLCVCVVWQVVFDAMACTSATAQRCRVACAMQHDNDDDGPVDRCTQTSRTSEHSQGSIIARFYAPPAVGGLKRYRDPSVCPVAQLP